MIFCSILVFACFGLHFCVLTTFLHFGRFLAVLFACWLHSLTNSVVWRILGCIAFTHLRENFQAALLVWTFFSSDSLINQPTCWIIPHPPLLAPPPAPASAAPWFFPRERLDQLWFVLFLSGWDMAWFGLVWLLEDLVWSSWHTSSLSLCDQRILTHYGETWGATGAVLCVAVAFTGCSRDTNKGHCEDGVQEHIS